MKPKLQEVRTALESEGPRGPGRRYSPELRERVTAWADGERRLAAIQRGSSHARSAVLVGSKSSETESTDSCLLRASSTALACNSSVSFLSALWLSFLRAADSRCVGGVQEQTARVGRLASRASIRPQARCKSGRWRWPTRRLSDADVPRGLTAPSRAPE